MFVALARAEVVVLAVLPVQPTAGQIRDILGLRDMQSHTPGRT